ncbi:hypothetical protein [Fusicatenibacter sp.]
MGQIKQSGGWKKDCAINYRRKTGRKQAAGKLCCIRKEKTEVDKLQTPRGEHSPGSYYDKKEQA